MCYNKDGDSMGKLIVICGSDCSGKETQAKKLVDALNKDFKAIYFSFPNYDSPTGKIIQNECLGKNRESYFDEGFTSVDPYVSSLYYVTDRRYNLPKLNELLNSYDYVICDRYTESNYAHQGGKIKDKEERLKFYNFLERLEYDMLSLPKPDKVIFLSVSVSISCSLLDKRGGKDSAEKDLNYLTNSYNTYKEIAQIYNFDVIDCVKDDKLLSIDEIHSLVLEKIKNED